MWLRNHSKEGAAVMGHVTDRGNEIMTYQFLGIFKTHAAHMYNHLVHSAETSPNTHTFKAVCLLQKS